MQRFAISLRALPIALLAALLAMPTGVVAQTKKFVGLGRGLTVNDYALQCQHPVMKSEPDSRFAACIAYVVSAAEQAVERAKAAMKEDHGSEEVAAIQASLQKALVQLHVKRRRHS